MKNFKKKLLIILLIMVIGVVLYIYVGGFASFAVIAGIFGLGTAKNDGDKLKKKQEVLEKELEEIKRKKGPVKDLTDKEEVTYWKKQ